MSNYNAEFESQVSVYRAARRLLLVNSIHFGVSRADFETACRERLTQPASARFFWRQPQAHWTQHRGWVFVGFELRSELRRALVELTGWTLRGRVIGVRRASRVAVSRPVSNDISILTQHIASPPARTGKCSRPCRGSTRCRGSQCHHHHHHHHHHNDHRRHHDHRRHRFSYPPSW